MSSVKFLDEIELTRKKVLVCRLLPHLMRSFCKKYRSEKNVSYYIQDILYKMCEKHRIPDLYKKKLNDVVMAVTRESTDDLNKVINEFCDVVTYNMTEEFTCYMLELVQ
jgi:hypothetical protein